MKFLGIIPARYASTRFPAKPLALLGGKTVSQRVYEQVAGVLDEVYVATDDERIEAAVQAFGGKVIMTSPHHNSGTDRCYEAATRAGGDFDVVINIQGDEPFIQPSQLEAIKECFNDATTQIATLVKPFTEADGFEALENPNSPKVVLTKTAMHSISAARLYRFIATPRRKIGCRDRCTTSTSDSMLTAPRC
jgi:3-deoxy-manno-octulosonate cytidylyltransferase (CMP-KDO synthetase)